MYQHTNHTHTAWMLPGAINVVASECFSVSLSLQLAPHQLAPEADNVCFYLCFCLTVQFSQSLCAHWTVAFTWWWSSSCWWLWASRWSVCLSAFTTHARFPTRASKGTKDSTCGTSLLVLSLHYFPQNLPQMWISSLIPSICASVRFVTYPLNTPSYLFTNLLYFSSSCLWALLYISISPPWLFSPSVSSSLRFSGCVVFPGSREAPQSDRAGGQLSGEPLRARRPGWQPGLVFLAGRGQRCDSLCRLWSGGHEPHQTAQTGNQETWRTHHLFSGPALLKGAT